MDNNNGFMINDAVEFQVKRRFSFGKAFRNGMIGLIIIALIVLLGAYIHGIVKYRNRFFNRTNINGVDASNLTVEEVENQVAELIGSYELRIVERDNKVEIIKGNEIDYRYVSQGEVENFMKQQNSFTWPLYIGKDIIRTFDSSTSFDKDLLKKKMGKLDCFNKKKVQKPKDARIEFKKGKYVVTPEVMGNALNNDAAREYITQSIGFAKREIVLEEEDLYQKASVLKNDKKLKQLCKNLNQYLGAEITFEFGQRTVTVDADRIKEWLVSDADGGVKLDEDAVYAFVYGLSDQYDTYGKLHEFTTHDGRVVSLYADEYGWEMDCDITASNLVNDILSGNTCSARIEYLHTAQSHDNGDCGDSYVEVDMGMQHVWMYVDGREVVSSDCVSGMYVDESRRTPEGIYTLYYKESPSILRGENAEYESYVEYWMPFNGGIGLHDATWRYGVFGGDIYMYDGSHGCINLPLEVAGEIYQYIYEGYPVICYY